MTREEIRKCLVTCDGVGEKKKAETMSLKLGE